jgi:putative ATP-dependent endonuclease of OLD family
MELLEKSTTQETATQPPTKKSDILVDCLRISGFRGIQNLEITFAPMTVLIGPNNSGKTTVLKAVGLAMGDYGRYVTEEDFFIGADSQGNETKASEILVDARIVPISDNEQFDQAWQAEFGDKIKSEANGKQYVAIRTKVFPNLVKGGFQTERHTMEKWPDFSTWITGAGKLTKMSSKIESVPFFSIEAQRDIHSELKDKSSFVGKVLSGVEYDKQVISDLEKAIEEINKEAVAKSTDLQRLKDHLTQLNQTFQGAGNAEITPFPKKMRDLSKNFSVHFGETEKNTFAMEYHGMGTRSWASMLTVRAFMETLRTKHEEEVEPFFPILAAEEPEAHLHPNAQKTLYDQLAATNAQVIVSTHSPYIASMPDISHLRSLIRMQQGIIAKKLEYAISSDDKKKLAREIMAHRGEILFSRALVLFEGITEEQLIPAMFEIFTGGRSMFSLGVSCINVGSVNNYSAFIKLACSFGIPVFIISDNDGNAKTKVDDQIQKLNDEGVPLNAHSFGIAYCASPNDIEAELVNVLKIQDEVKEALFRYETNDETLNDLAKAAKRAEINALNDQALIVSMKKIKTRYSAFLADVIRENPNNKKTNQLIIQAALDAFNAIKGWIQT